MFRLSGIVRSAFEGAVLIDTSAVIALHSTAEQFHSEAANLYSTAVGFAWYSVDVTSHECFTLIRYRDTFEAAMEHYQFLRNSSLITTLRFTPDDEAEAEAILHRYNDQDISCHDALCAAVMKRIGIARVFTFDRHFYVLGFEVLPGVVG